MKKIFAVFILLVSVLSACAQATSEPNDFPPAPTAIATVVSVRATAVPTVPLTPIGGVDYPEAVFKARDALASELGISAGQITVTNIEPVNWPDGCLGLAGPDAVCTQAIVSGYRVTLAARQAQYIFRTNESGSVTRPEKDVRLANTSEEARPLVSWQSENCDLAVVSISGFSSGACGGSLALSPWQQGKIPDVMLEFIDRYAAFDAETPAGKLVFNGTGMNTATPAEQRAIAEWTKRQFLAVQSGRADTGQLVFAYSRSGGFAGFCDEVSVYLDGSVNVTNCKGRNVDFRLNATQLELIYAWYDGLKPIDYSHTDPATADAMTIKLEMKGHGQKSADDAKIRAIVQFAADLVTQASFKAKAPADLPAVHQALTSYFGALHTGDYILASKLYGGDTSLLQTWNPDILNNLPN